MPIVLGWKTGTVEDDQFGQIGCVAVRTVHRAAPGAAANRRDYLRTYVRSYPVCHVLPSGARFSPIWRTVSAATWKNVRRTFDTEPLRLTCSPSSKRIARS